MNIEELFTQSEELSSKIGTLQGAFEFVADAILNNPSFLDDAEQRINLTSFSLLASEELQRIKKLAGDLSRNIENAEVSV